MPYEQWSNIVKKSMAYDLIQILHAEEHPEGKTCTPEEVEKMITTYITMTTGNH